MPSNFEIVCAGVLTVNEAIRLYLLALLKKKNNRKKRQIWVKEWIKRRNTLGASVTLLTEWEIEDMEMFKNHLRMTVENFNYLLSLVAPVIQREDSVMREALPAKLKLQVTLRFIATGDSFSSLQSVYRVPKCTISVFLPEVLSAIEEALQDYLKVPQTQEEWFQKMEEFWTMWNFLNCCGAMDGKHVVIRCPSKSGSYFYNYKKTFSMVLFAVVDANYNFIYIDVGKNGRTNDAAVFSDCTFSEALERNFLQIPKHGLFIGDDAFPLKTYLLKPYSKRNLTIQEKIFNYRCSRARRVVENAFGILVSRFRIFERPIALLQETTEQLIRTTCVLHNWLRQNSQPTAPYVTQEMIDVESWETGSVIPGNYRQNPVNGLVPLRNMVRSNNYPKDAGALRDHYAKLFCTSLAVPWQTKMIS